MDDEELDKCVEYVMKEIAEEYAKCFPVTDYPSSAEDGL